MSNYTTQQQKKTREESLKDILEDELYEMLRLTSLMQPKSDEEFIAVALPNIHIKVHQLIATNTIDTINKCKEGALDERTFLANLLIQSEGYDAVDRKKLKKRLQTLTNLDAIAKEV